MSGYDDVDAHLSGGYFNLEVGDNQVRVVSFPGVILSHWKDNKKLGPCTGDECGFCESEDEETAKISKRFLFNVIDRKDGQGKIAEFPPSVMQKIRKYQKAEDSGYDTEVAPYDFIVERQGAGKQTKYDVRAAMKSTELNVDEEAIVAKLIPIDEVVEKSIKRMLGEDDDIASVEDAVDEM